MPYSIKTDASEKNLIQKLMNDPNSILIEPNVTLRIKVYELGFEIYFSRLFNIEKEKINVFPKATMGLSLLYHLKVDE